jgi:hypothetical protein
VTVPLTRLRGFGFAKGIVETSISFTSALILRLSLKPIQALAKLPLG